MINRVWKDAREYGPAVTAVLLVYFLMHKLWGVFCPMILITGFPCPGCGITRAILFALTGQLARSFNANPLGLFVLAAAVYVIIMRYVLGRKVKGLKIIVILFVAAAVIIYFYRMYRFFPNRPPMVYTNGSLLERYLPHYQELTKKIIGLSAL